MNHLDAALSKSEHDNTWRSAHALFLPIFLAGLLCPGVTGVAWALSSENAQRSMFNALPHKLLLVHPGGAAVAHQRANPDQPTRGSGAMGSEALDVLPIQLPPLDGIDALKRAFDERRQAFAEGDKDRAHEAERDILVLQELLSIDNLFSFSGAILVEARGLLDKDPDEAWRRARLASELSPSLSEPHWIALQAMLQSKKGTDIDFRELASTLRSAVKASFIDPQSRAARHMDWLLILPFIAIVTTCIALTISLCRSIRYLLHDLSHLTPSGVGPVLILPLILILATLAWALGFGLFGPLAFLGFLLIPYLSASERATLSLCLIILGGIPFLTNVVSARLPFLDADAQALYFIDRGGLEGTHLKEKEEHLLEQAEHSYAISYVLGRKAVRLGDYRRAIPLLRQATRLNPAAPESWVALGNAYLLTGELENAFENYSRARQHDPGNPMAAFNLSGYYLRKAQMESSPDKSKQMLGLSRSMFDEAGMLSAELKNLPLDMQANLFVRTMPLDLHSLTKSAHQPMLARNLSDRVTKVIFGNHSQSWALKGVISVLALWLLYALAGFLLPNARPCFKCGAPTCVRCEERSPSPGLCAPCFNVFGQQGRLDSTACAQREWQIQQNQKRWLRFVLAMATLFPCSGALWCGRTIRGALGTACCGLLFTLIIFPDGFVPAVFTTIPVLFKRLPAIILLVILWSFSLRITYRALHSKSQRHPLPLGKLP